MRQGAILVQRLEHRVVPALEQKRVRVCATAVDLGDDRVRAVLPVRLQAVDDALALQDAHSPTVERDVDLGHAALRLAVVVDRRDALGERLLLDRRSGAGVDGDLDDHLGARGEALVGLRLLLLCVTVRVVDLGGDPARLERGRDRRGVVMHPPDRRRGLGEQDANVTACGLLLRACCGARGNHRPDDGDGHEQQDRRPA